MLVGGDGTAAAQWLADMAAELQRVEPSNAALMVQLVSVSCRHTQNMVQPVLECV